MGNIIGLFGAAGTATRTRQDWSNQDLAELYRVVSALVQAGMHVETERGRTDEGEPWFAFCHGDSGEVIAHFARIDGEYVIDASIFATALRGPDLRAIVQRFVAENPVSLPSPEAPRRGNVVLHPAALMTMFVATIILMETPSRGHAAEAPGAVAAGDDGAHDTPVSAVLPDFPPDATPDARDPDAMPDARDDDEHPRFGDKTLLLTAVVAVAVEAARNIHDSEASAAQPGLGHDLPDGLALADARDEVIHLDLAPTRDAFADAPAGDAGGQAADLTVPETASTDVRLFADRDGHVEFDPAAVSVPEAAAKAAAAHADSREPAHAALDSVFPEFAGGSAARHVEAPQPSAEHAGVDAGAWLEEKIAAEGWSVDLFDRDSDIADRLARVLDGDAGPERAEESPKLILDDGHEQADDSPAGPHAPSGFDTAGQRAVAAFQASDDDMGYIKDDHGNVVVFDQSDLVDGDLLALHSWAFGNDSTIAILGQADTVDHVLAMVA